ncbi:MAG: phosphoadenylyl-sulfate reductase [Planctomycetaceae bacterium]|nr:phosphoadenylyl-sulfate reductase [Planctomycetaceae bacterium]
MDDRINLDELRFECRGLDAQALLQKFAVLFPERVVLASSMAAEDQVLTDMVCRAAPQIEIFTLDTGRLPQETYDVIEETRRHYGIEIRVLFPDAAQIEQLTAQGPNLFRNGIEQRKQCCNVRKVQPLRRALANMDAWVCGLRREQSPTREQIDIVQWDRQFDLIKLSPLADWTTEQVWNYIRLHRVPYNALHDRGYSSISCAPCTRAIGAGEDLRAGRWWWEMPEHKECGLHFNEDSAMAEGAARG